MKLLKDNLGGSRMEEVEELMRQGFTLEEALKAVSNAERQNGGGGNIGGGGGGKREVSALEREMEAALASGMSAEEVNMIQYIFKSSTFSRPLHFLDLYILESSIFSRV